MTDWLAGQPQDVILIARYEHAEHMEHMLVTLQERLLAARQ
jgi:hypothetical protein